VEATRVGRLTGLANKKTADVSAVTLLNPIFYHLYRSAAVASRAFRSRAL
jgi:hypothetical protein